MRPRLSVYIIAYNEEEKIADAVSSVVDWADEVVVIDSHSQDRTAEIAERMGARVVQVAFSSFGKLRNDAIAACSHAWIFSLDADERCTKAARMEIEETLRSPQADAYYIPRKNWFMGRWIKHCGWYPDYRQPQLFREGALKFVSDDEVHEGYEIVGKHAYLSQPIWQIPFLNLEEILNKTQRYSTLGGKKLLRQGKNIGILSALGHASWSFIRIYFLKLGFLDGAGGFVIALGNFQGTFYRYAKCAWQKKGWGRQPPEADI